MTQQAYLGAHAQVPAWARWLAPDEIRHELRIATEAAAELRQHQAELLHWQSKRGAGYHRLRWHILQLQQHCKVLDQRRADARKALAKAPKESRS